MNKNFINFEKLIAKTFYLFIAIFLVLLFYILIDVKGATDKYVQILTILFAIVIAVFSIFLGTYVTLFNDLNKIGESFDVIKNDIALREIKHPDEFSLRVSSLLCNFCNFPFLDIKYSFLYVKNFNLISSTRSESINIKINRKNFTPTYSERLKKYNLKINDYKLDEIQKKSSGTEEVFFYEELRVDNEQFQVYIIPIWFSGTYYGFIGVLTTKKLWKRVRLFLSDFEDLYVDDQLVHVIDTNKQILQKQFYREIDHFSNKITKLEYKTLNEYQYDLLSFLVNKINCKAGLFATIYDEECVSIFKDENEKSPIMEYFKGMNVDLSADIFSDANINFKFILSIPILIDKLQGVIYLFDDTDECFKYFNNTLREVEDIKLDNDLENLANQLNQTVKINAFISD